MKKFKILLVFVLFLVLGGCNKVSSIHSNMLSGKTTHAKEINNQSTLSSTDSDKDESELDEEVELFAGNLSDSNEQKSWFRIP